MLPTIWLSLLVATLDAKLLPLPPGFKACSRNHPDLRGCILESAKEAIPVVLRGDRRLGVPPLDPLLLPHLRVERGEGTAVMSVFDTRDLNVTGLAGIELTDCDPDLDARRIGSRYRLGRLQVLCDYTMEGRVLLLPITGEGKANITLVGNTLTHEFQYTLVQVGEDTLMSPTKEDLTFNTSRAYFNFTGLFGGNARLGQEMNAILNEHWPEVMSELGPDVVASVRHILSSILHGVVAHFSYDTILPP